MKYLVVYNNDFTTGKEFDDVNKAVDYIFEQVGKNGAAKDDYKIYQGIEMSCNAEKENKKEKAVKGAEPSGTVYGVQMSIFDMEGMEQFKEAMEAMNEAENCECDCEDCCEDKKVKSIELSFNSKEINEALNKVLAIINEYDIDYDLDGAELTLNLASLIANNIEVDIETTD